MDFDFCTTTPVKPTRDLFIMFEAFRALGQENALSAPNHIAGLAWSHVLYIMEHYNSLCEEYITGAQPQQTAAGARNIHQGKPRPAIRENHAVNLKIQTKPENAKTTQYVSLEVQSCEDAHREAKKPSALSQEKRARSRLLQAGSLTPLK